MTEIAVKFDRETGAASIELTGATVVEPRFRLRDTVTDRFLTKRGWGKTAAFLPGEAVIGADKTVLAVDADVAKRINVGTSLSLEQPASNIFANLVWPDAATVAAITPVPTPVEEPEAAIPETPKAVEPDVVAAPYEPVSLEPTIRDEAITPFRLDESLAAKPLAGDAPDDEDEEDESRPWGMLVAAALVFLLLGSVLTYAWQSSSYDSDLKSAMRALETERDQERANFQKQLTEAQTKAGVTSSSAISAASAKVETLTDQSTTLTKERNEARAALADQEATAAALQERLTTANGEIETLKASAEAGATEQSAVFNERIATLNGELDKARTELEKTRSEISGREQALNKAGDDLEQANAQIASLKKASSDNQASQKTEVDGKIKSLTDQLAKAKQDLSTRDQSLRDVQSKLSVANVQIEALKQVAGKATESDLERGTLADRITEMTTQLDSADKELLAKDEELAKAKTSLDTANALLASNSAALKKAQSEAAQAPADNAQPADTQSAELKEERDLYAKELSTLTENFTAMKAERDKLAATVTALQKRTADPGDAPNVAAVTPDTPDEPTQPAEPVGLWGAAAIDRNGTVHSVQNQSSEKAATSGVAAACRNESGGRCEPLRSYSNGCFALARIQGEGPRNDNFGYAVNKNLKTAQAAAVTQCEQLGETCTVRLTTCSPGDLAQAAGQQ